MTGFSATLSSDWMQTMGWTLLHSLWEVALVAAMVVFVLATLHRRSANVRYAIACAGLLAAVLLPVVTYCLMLERAASEASVTVVSLDDPLQATATAQPSSIEGCVMAWLLGVLWLSVWNLGGWIAVERLKHLGTMPVSEQLAARVAKLVQRMNVNRSVNILQTRLVDVPVVVGWLRPVILMPVGILAGFSPAQLDAMLARELAHVRRHDYLVNLLQTVAETLLFFHPGIWWISRRIRIEREYCCDDAAADVCGSKVDYAMALTALEESRAVPGLAVAASEGTTLSRVRRILGTSAPRGHPAKSLGGSPAVVALLAAAISCLAWTPEGGPSTSAMENCRPEEFVKAQITQHFDTDGRFFVEGRKLTIEDASEIERLTGFFPGIGKGKRSDRAGSWEGCAIIRFHRRSGRTARVTTDYRDWSEGHGDWPVHGKLAGFIENKFADALSQARRNLAEQAIRLEPAVDTDVFAGQRATTLDLSVVLDLFGEREDAESFTDDHRFFQRDVKQLVERKRT